MDGYDLCLQGAVQPAFDELPPANRRRVYDVDYAWVRGPQGGELFYTRTGWAIAKAVLPEQWFDEERYWRIGRALRGATGSVYRVPVAHPRRAEFSLVVKFCRFGQDVGLTLTGEDSVFDWPAALLEGAEFLDPFAEFGGVMQLRRAARGRVRTMHPLLIYGPGAHYLDWQLGRDPSRRALPDARLAADQARVTDRPQVSLDWTRPYVLVYQWVDGIDLEEAWRRGLIDEAMMRRFTRAVAEIVWSCGFAVLDHKPRHVIIRPDAKGGWLRRGNDWQWALIDYELLTPAAGWAARRKQSAG